MKTNSECEAMLKELEKRVVRLERELFKFKHDGIRASDFLNAEEMDLYRGLKLEADVLGLSKATIDWLHENIVCTLPELINLSELVLAKTLCHTTPIGMNVITGEVRELILKFKTSSIFRSKILEYIRNRKEKSLKIANIFLSALDVYADIRSGATNKGIKLELLESYNAGYDGVFLSFYKKKFISGENIQLNDDCIDFFGGECRKQYRRPGVVELENLSMLIESSEDFNITLVKKAIAEDLNNMYLGCAQNTKKYEIYQEFLNFIYEYEV